LVARAVAIALPFLAAIAGIVWFFVRPHDINYYPVRSPPQFCAAAVGAGAGRAPPASVRSQRTPPQTLPPSRGPPGTGPPERGARQGGSGAARGGIGEGGLAGCRGGS